MDKIQMTRQLFNLLADLMGMPKVERLVSFEDFAYHCPSSQSVGDALSEYRQSKTEIQTLQDERRHIEQLIRVVRFQLIVCDGDTLSLSLRVTDNRRLIVCTTLTNRQLFTLLNSHYNASK